MISILQVFSAFMIFFVPCYNGDKNCTQELKKPNMLCSTRYDLYVGNLDQIYANFSCGEWYAKLPICNAELRIQSHNAAPYMYTLPNGDVDGIIPALLNLIMSACCNNCTRLVYTKPFKTIKETANWFYNSSAYSIMLPALSTSTSTKYFGNPFVKLIKSPGVAYITIDKSAEKFLEKTLQSMGGTWPLIVTVALWTIEGGIIMWLLDQHQNPEEFPKSFIRGTLEGTWWSYVSMTTVGYGDKTPRSIQGRLFAVLWITIGVAASSILTASLSSSLTSAALPGKTSLRSLKVGFLRRILLSYEENIIYREGGEPIAFEEATDMMKAFKDGKISGILMDTLVLDYYWNAIKEFGIAVEIKTDVESSNTAIGLMFSSPVFQPWADFISSFLLENKDAESRLLTESINAMKVKFSTGNTIDATSGELALYKGFTSIIIVSAITCAVTFLIGVAFELLRKCHFASKKQSKVIDHEMETQTNHAVLDDRLEQLSKQIANLQETALLMKDQYGKTSFKA